MKIFQQITAVCLLNVLFHMLHPVLDNISQPAHFDTSHLWSLAIMYASIDDTQPSKMNKREATLAFIEAYTSLPVLWDTENRHYSNRVKKAAAYDNLIEKLKMLEPNASRESVVKKINNLCSTFRKELKKSEQFQMIRNFSRQSIRPITVVLQ